jgi:hypothetical protein
MCTKIENNIFHKIFKQQNKFVLYIISLTLLKRKGEIYTSYPYKRQHKA